MKDSHGLRLHQAAARDKRFETRPHPTMNDNDDDIDYEQLFDETPTPAPKPETHKSVKRVRFAPTIDEQSPTPILSRPPSTRPRFDLEFDFDSLASPSDVLLTQNTHWKSAFLSDLHSAKTNPQSLGPAQSTQEKSHEDSLWDFMRESNPELFEKLEKAKMDAPKSLDRFSMQQPPADDTKSSTGSTPPECAPTKQGTPTIIFAEKCLCTFDEPHVNTDARFDDAHR